jgi:Retrotransposon gag protein
LKNSVNTVKINGVEPDAIKLRAFPFSLGDKARNWLRSLDTGTIRIWDQMSDAFLSKYFSHLKLLPFVLKLQISDKEEENLSARHMIDTKSCCVFAHTTDSRSGSYFRFSMKDLSSPLN